MGKFLEQLEPKQRLCGGVLGPVSVLYVPYSLTKSYQWHLCTIFIKSLFPLGIVSRNEARDIWPLLLLQMLFSEYGEQYRNGGFREGMLPSAPNKAIVSKQ